MLASVRIWAEKGRVYSVMCKSMIAIGAVVFLPLTFITGLYGMNVKTLPYADQPWSFDAIMGACALIAAGITIHFFRRHWLGRG